MRVGGIALLALFCSLTCTAQTPEAAPSKPAEDQAKFTALIQEVQVLQARKRYTDAFAKLDEAEKLRPTSPDVFNIRGSMLLSSQLRDADKAREQFRKARELDPTLMPPHFNLSEVDFVVGSFADAEKGFTKVLTDYPKLPLAVRHFITFKVVVCQIKQDKFEAAEKLAKDSFSFMDDTPAYYFSKAVIELQKKNEKVGNEWLAKAQVIFKPADNASYLDSLMEAHYIDTMGIQNEPSK